MRCINKKTPKRGIETMLNTGGFWANITHYRAATNSLQEKLKKN